MLAPSFALVATAACSVPALDTPDGDTDPAEAPRAASVPDPARAELVAELEDLRATVTAARDAFAAASEADGPSAIRSALQDASAALVTDAPGGGEVPDTGALLPAESGDRDRASDADAALTAVLTVAREAGVAGSRVIDVLRDPVAGDLGGWERDAAGQLELVDDVVATADGVPVEETDLLVLGELPGLGPQAVAWARLAEGASTADDARSFARRGTVATDVMLDALEAIDLPAEP